MPKTPLFLFSLTFVLSLITRLILDLDVPVYLLLINLVALYFIGRQILKISLLKWRAGGTFIIFLILPWWLFVWPQASSNLILGPQEIEAWVCQWSEPDWSLRQVILCPLDVQDQGGKIIANLPLYPPVYFGDSLRIICNLKIPDSFADFDYPAYLARLNIFRQCAWPQVTDYQLASHGHIAQRLIFTFKNQAAKLITKNLPEPEAGLVLAIILGYRQSLTPSLQENFRLAGLSHLTAVSGSHISILTALFLIIYLFLGGRRRWAWLPLSAILAIYVVLVGARPPAIRAFLMGTSTLIAWRLGRLPHPLSILTAVAALSLMFNPLSILDVAWQLSFGALLGIFLFFSQWQFFLQTLLGRLPVAWHFYLRPPALALGLSLSVQLLIWPIAGWHFQILSLTTIISNLLIFWAFAPLMSILPLVLLAAYFWPSLSFVLFSPVYQLANYLVKVAALAAGFTTLSLNLEISWPTLIIYYSALAIFYYYLRLYQQKLQIKKINSLKS